MQGGAQEMPVQRKIFRIEQTTPVDVTAGLLDGAGISPADRQEILAELKALHDLIERRRPASSANAYESDELRELKSETDAIYHALTRTKQEIAALHVNAFGPPPARMTRELDAVVESAERATQQILGAAEDIEDAANTLSASLQRQQEQALALDIQDNVLRIFEACNFQDLTGQRIAKVLTTLKFVEDRIAHMIEIWGGIDAFRTYTAAATAVPHDVATLHGPKLDGDQGHVSQDDVDAMFATG
jgi:chemotaxis protein CheZ